MTTKLASCFTCSLFMYAAGFPPSAIHLGRGESWVPYYEMRPDTVSAKGSAKDSAPFGEYDPIGDRVIAALNDRWRIECRQLLNLGVEIMLENDKAAVSDSHRDRLARLDAYLGANKDDIYVGANLVLDAVTIHDGEIARIDRTLKLPS